MSIRLKANTRPSKSLGAQFHMKKKGKPLLNLLYMVLGCKENLHEDLGWVDVGNVLTLQSENDEDEARWLGP